MLKEIIVPLAFLLAVFIYRKTKISSFIIELLIGILIGKSFLHLVEPTPWIDFLSELGLLFLMFLAGLEANLSKYPKLLPKGALIGFLAFIIPFGSIFLYLNSLGIYSFQQMSLISAALSTTSMAIVYPFLKERKLTETHLGKILLIAAIIVDVLSMFALGFSIAEFSFIIFYAIPFLIICFVIMPYLIRYLRKHFKKRNLFHWEVRFVFLFLFIVTIFFEKLGLHAVLGAFFVGLIMSEFNESESIKHKFDVIGFSFLIPFFFITVGINFDLWSLFDVKLSLFVILLLIAWITKTIAVIIPLIKKVKSKRDLLSYGFLFNARLSLGIAAAQAGHTAGLINTSLYSVIIAIVIVSSLLGFFLAGVLKRPIEETKNMPDLI